MSTEDPTRTMAPSQEGAPFTPPLNNGVSNGIELTIEEEESVDLFMAHVNSWRRARSFAPLSRESTVKFLMARKFSVDRALSLYQQHELMRIREKLTSIDITDDNSLKNEVNAAKFTGNIESPNVFLISE